MKKCIIADFNEFQKLVEKVSDGTIEAYEKSGYLTINYNTDYYKLPKDEYDNAILLNLLSNELKEHIIDIESQGTHDDRIIYMYIA